MAGIGFELKKLFKGSGFFSNLRAYAYSALVSLGPFILCTIVIVAIMQFLGYMNVSFKDRELFIASVVYSFIFSQIIVSGFKMIITRFIADMLYGNKFEYIMPSLYGILSITVPLSGIIGILFFWNSPLQFEIKLVSYLLFIELVIVFIMMEYLSTLKDYMKIVKSFLMGIGTILALSFVFLKFTSLQPVFGLLLAMDLGFFIIIVSLMVFLKNFFGKSANKYFEFMRHLDKYPALFFVAFFYTLGLYIHNFLFWTSELGVGIAGTYVYAPTYDVPTFYAFLSIMPSMIIFVVSIETSFYDKYKAYYTLITGKGNLKDIENAKKDMTRTLWSEIRNIMELQLFFTLVFIAAGYYLLPKIGLSQLSVDIFDLLVLGAYFNIIMLIIMLLLLYFEDRKGALFVSATFFASNGIFTYLTMHYSENTYGLGFFLAALVSMILALIELLVYIKNINYHTFCGQPIIYREKKGWLGRIVDALTPTADKLNIGDIKKKGLKIIIKIMKFKKPVLLIFIFTITIILLFSMIGFLPSSLIKDFDFLPGIVEMPVFNEDSRLVYVLQGAGIKQLLKADFDVAVVDPDDSRLTAKNIVSLQKQGKKIIAYLSIGEAEDYRPYWERDWCTGNPSFVDGENPDWHGNYRVRFWDRRWQDIVINRLDELVKAGYDGAYLDVVDVYEYYRDNGYIFSKIAMINFVYRISKHAKSSKEDFLIIPQNGEELSTDYVYIKSIDGIGREDIWFNDDLTVDKKDTELTLKYLARIKQLNKFVFVISYAEEEITKNRFLKFAKKYGFIPYLGKRELNTIEEI